MLPLNLKKETFLVFVLLVAQTSVGFSQTQASAQNVSNTSQIPASAVKAIPLTTSVKSVELAQVSPPSAPKTPAQLLEIEALKKAQQLNEFVTETDEEKLPQQEAAPKQMAKPLDEVTVNVQSFRVSGFDALSQTDVNRLLAEFTGSNKSFEDLSNAATTIARHLQTEFDLYLAFAYVPTQKMADGTIEIRVLPGVLDQVLVQWPDETLRVKREIIQKHLEVLKPGSLIRVRDIERVVFLLNDLRGIDVSFEVKPGSKTGTATLVATPSNGKAYTGTLSLDNNGSNLAGKIKATASVTKNSPLGLGDSVNFTRLHTDTGGLVFSLLGYNVPIGSDGFKLGFNVSRVDYYFKTEDVALGLEGDSTALSVYGLYPWVRSRNVNVFATFGTERRRYSDRLRTAGTDARKEIRTTKMGLTADLRDSVFGGGINSASLNVNRVSLGFPIGPQGGFGALDDATSATKYNWSYSRLQTLVPRKWMLWFDGRGQWSGANLDSTEQCSLGGMNSVRAFEQGVAAGDMCQIYTAELRYLKQFASRFGTQYVSLAAFYDLGRVQYRHDASQQAVGFNNIDKLKAYGVALNWELDSNFSAQLIWARPDSFPNAAEDAETRRVSALIQYRF